MNDAAERLLARIETLRQPDVLSTEQYRLVKMDLDAALDAERRATVERMRPYLIHGEKCHEQQVIKAAKLWDAGVYRRPADMPCSCGWSAVLDEEAER